MRSVLLATILLMGVLSANAQNIPYTALCDGKRPPEIAKLPAKERAEVERQLAELKDHIEAACEQAEVSAERAKLPRTPVHDTADPDPELTHKLMVTAATFTPDGRAIVSVSPDLTLRLWDVASGRQLRVVARFPKRPQGLALSPDGKQVAVSIDEEGIWIIDIETGKETSRIPPVKELSFRPVVFDRAGRLLTPIDQTTVEILPASLQGQPIRLGGHAKAIGRIAVSDAARLIATIDETGTVYLWDLASGRRLETIPVQARTLAFSPDGKRLAIASTEGLLVRDISARRSSRLVARNFAMNTFSLAFTHDGAGLITGRIHPELWDAETGARLRHFGPFSDFTSSLAISPDGKYLLTTHTNSSELRLWEIETGTFFRRFGRNIVQ